MSGGQDEASEYIHTGGVNVFKKTERTKCGNCVYWEHDLHPDYGCKFGSCFRHPPLHGVATETLPDHYCGEFVDREFHQSVKDAEEVKDQPAGELREWWGVLNWNGLDGAIYESEEIAMRASSDRRIVPVREVPSPERVRAALDEWAKATGWKGWDAFVEFYTGKKRIKTLLTLLRSLGIDTEGL